MVPSELLSLPARDDSAVEDGEFGILFLLCDDSEDSTVDVGIDTVLTRWPPLVVIWSSLKLPVVLNSTPTLVIPVVALVLR